MEAAEDDKDGAPEPAMMLPEAEDDELPSALSIRTGGLPSGVAGFSRSSDLSRSAEFDFVTAAALLADERDNAPSLFSRSALFRSRFAPISQAHCARGDRGDLGKPRL